MAHQVAVGLAAVIMFFAFFGVYIFVAFVFSRVGKKCGVGSFLQFLIPIWNAILLCDCAKISRWVTVAVVAPGLILFPLNKLGIVVTPEAIDRAAQFITFAGNAYIWGKIAGRMGKNEWLWGIFTPILAFIPTLFLAFGSAMPLDRVRRTDDSQRDGTRYIDV